jgi:hypothetical protein
MQDESKYPDPHPDFWFVYSRLSDEGRERLGLRRRNTMNQADRQKVDLSLYTLNELERAFKEGHKTPYYSWIRKKLRPSQVESVLRLVDHARKLEALQDSGNEATLDPEQPASETKAADIIAPPGWGKSISIIAVALPLIEAVVPQRDASEPFRVLILVPGIVIRSQLAEKVDLFFADAPGRQPGDMVELVQASEVRRGSKDYQVRFYIF